MFGPAELHLALPVSFGVLHMVAYPRLSTFGADAGRSRG